MNRAEAGMLGYQKTKKFMEQYRERRRKEAKRKWGKRKCPRCGKAIPYEKRRNTYCSHSCAATTVNLQRVEPRECRCGKRLLCSQENSCSHACFNDRRYAGYIKRWLAGEEPGGAWYGVSNHVHRWLRERKGEQCWKCGWKKRNPKTGKIPLQADHKNGNPENHRPDNLRLLCPNCHSLTPSFGGLNLGNGRKQRRARKAGVV